MFFLAVFTTLVSPQTPLEIQTLYGLWMCVATSIWFAIVAVLFPTSPSGAAFWPMATGSSASWAPSCWPLR